MKNPQNVNKVTEIQVTINLHIFIKHENFIYRSQIGYQITIPENFILIINSLKEKTLWENNTHFFIFVQINSFPTFFRKSVQSKIALGKFYDLSKNLRILA